MIHPNTVPVAVAEAEAVEAVAGNLEDELI